jgi:hypothetical protein
MTGSGSGRGGEERNIPVQFITGGMSAVRWLSDRRRAVRRRRFRIPLRVGELAVGLAVLPIGAGLSIGLAASSGPAPEAPVSGLASSLLRFHVLPLSSGWNAPAVPVDAPALATLPPAPPLSRLTPTPVPTPRIPPASYPAGSIQAIITAAAQADGVDPSWMIRTAQCESGLRPNAYNPAGPYYGLFQFLMSTFRAHGGTNIWDPTQQSQIAASMFAAGDSSAWPVCSRAG